VTSVVQNGLLRQTALARAIGFPPSYPMPQASAADARAGLAAVLSGAKVLPPSMLDGHFLAFRPMLVRATELADGNFKPPPRLAYMGSFGLRDPGAPPPPRAPAAGGAGAPVAAAAAAVAAAPAAPAAAPAARAAAVHAPNELLKQRPRKAH
jgi:hypothetical protein